MIKTVVQASLRDPMRNQKGFTLIEIAIVLIIVGILIVPLMRMYHIYKQDRLWNETKSNVVLAQAALTNFYFDNFRYPCPADPTLGPGDLNYGKEDCAGVTATTGRDADRDSTNDGVLVGALPFADIGISQHEMQDGWNRKLGYAVTTRLTNMMTFDDRLGAVLMVDENNVDLIPPPAAPAPASAAHLSVYSHGEDGRGAYTVSGALYRACAGAGVSADRENCDNDGTIMQSRRGLSMALTSQYYDDYADYMMSTTSALWSQIPSTPDIMNRNTGNIGINTNAPSERLDVVGNIRASGEIHSNDICNAAGGDCFPAEAIGGTSGIIRCPLGQAMTGISNANEQCATISFPSTVPAVTCPNYVRGINSDGSLECYP